MSLGAKYVFSLYRIWLWDMTDASLDHWLKLIYNARHLPGYFLLSAYGEDLLDLGHSLLSEFTSIENKPVAINFCLKAAVTELQCIHSFAQRVQFVHWQLESTAVSYDLSAFFLQHIYIRQYLVPPVFWPTKPSDILICLIFALDVKIGSRACCSITCTLVRSQLAC